MFNKKKPQPKKFDLHQTISPATRLKDKKSLGSENLTTHQENAKKKRWLSRKKVFLIVLLTLITPLLIIVIWDLRNFSNASSKLFNNDNVLGVLATKPLQNSNDRVNILLVGYSIDDPGHDGAKLTDSIMILSLDKSNNTGYMLSIPRDLYVDIPDYGSAKINEAYQAGEKAKFSQKGYPDGGAGLLQKVVSHSFAIDIHYHVLINYSAVRQVVDALDGIDIEISSPDKRGVYDPNFKKEEGGALKLKNGKHHIDGQTALRLTRARGSTSGSYGFPQSDFNRTQNQQIVLSAIKQELTWKLVLNPWTNSKIFEAFSDNVRTNLELGETIPLYKLFNSVPSDKLIPVNLRDIDGVNLLSSYRTPTGQSSLVPASGISDFDDIQKAIKKLNQ